MPTNERPSIAAASRSSAPPANEPSSLAALRSSAPHMQCSLADTIACTDINITLPLSITPLLHHMVLALDYTEVLQGSIEPYRPNLPPDRITAIFRVSCQTAEVVETMVGSLPSATVSQVAITDDSRYYAGLEITLPESIAAVVHKMVLGLRFAMLLVGPELHYSPDRDDGRLTMNAQFRVQSGYVGVVKAMVRAFRHATFSGGSAVTYRPRPTVADTTDGQSSRHETRSILPDSTSVQVDVQEEPDSMFAATKSPIELSRAIVEFDSVDMAELKNTCPNAWVAEFAKRTKFVMDAFKIDVTTASGALEKSRGSVLVAFKDLSRAQKASATLKTPAKETGAVTQGPSV